MKWFLLYLAIGGFVGGLAFFSCDKSISGLTDDVDKEWEALCIFSFVTGLFWPVGLGVVLAKLLCQRKRKDNN